MWWSLQYFKQNHIGPNLWQIEITVMAALPALRWGGLTVEWYVGGFKKCPWEIMCLSSYYEIRFVKLFLTFSFFPGTIKTLLSWIKANLLKERPELFLQGDTVWVICLLEYWNLSFQSGGRDIMLPVPDTGARRVLVCSTTHQLL